MAHRKFGKEVGGENNRGSEGVAQWRTVTFLTGCSLFKNTYHGPPDPCEGRSPPDLSFFAAMLAAPLPITNEDS